MDTAEQREICYCDFVQVIYSDGDRIEIHHVTPDDGFDHVVETPEALDCPCRPTLERLAYDLYVADHRDAELDIPLADEQ